MGDWPPYLLLSCYVSLFWLRVKFDIFLSCECDDSPNYVSALKHNCNVMVFVLYRNFRARIVLFNNMLLRTRRVLSLFKFCGVSALLVLSEQYFCHFLFVLQHRKLFHSHKKSQYIFISTCNTSLWRIQTMEIHIKIDKAKVIANYDNDVDIQPA